MAIIENAYQWSVFTTTGTGNIIDARATAQSLTFGVETSADCTATIQILHRMGSSAGPRSVLSTVTLSSNAFTTLQFLGPLEFIAPRVTDKTAGAANTVTIYLKGN
jgi:hypothetical protein